MTYKGSCHCGRIAFEVEGELKKVTECSCSICSKRGTLHWFVPREALRLITPEENLATYTFSKATIRHRFCPVCGCAPFGEGADPSGKKMAAVNARCLDDVDLSAIPVGHFDGRRL
jgi:hypothetical protein